VTPRKRLAKSPRKIVLPKARAAEILSDLHVTQSERRHAQRAFAAVKKGKSLRELRRSELRVRYGESRRRAKTEK
jgi:hypothetical protein